MRLRASLQLIAVLALLAALIVPAAAQAGATKNAGSSGKNCSGKKDCSGKTMGAAESECGSDTPECHIDITVSQGPITTGAVCFSFDVSEGSCLGPTHGTKGWSAPSYFPSQGLQSWFAWTGQGPVRNVEYVAKANSLLTEAYIDGNVPSPGSATFNVTDAWNRMTGVHWRTVSKGAAPGTRGGPLYIDYTHKAVGSEVHIFGYMVRK